MRRQIGMRRRDLPTPNPEIEFASGFPVQLAPHCTINVTVVERVVAPEVAVTVIGYVPAGVPEAGLMVGP